MSDSRSRHPVLRILLVVAVLFGLIVAGAGWLRGGSGPSGPLDAKSYPRAVSGACTATRADFDAAVNQPAAPETTAQFVAAYKQLRVYVTELSSALKDLEPPPALAAPHQAYLTALSDLTTELDTLIDAPDDQPFSTAVAAERKKPVLAAMDRAGRAFTALHVDSAGCVVL